MATIEVRVVRMRSTVMMPLNCAGRNVVALLLWAASGCVVDGGAVGWQRHHTLDAFDGAHGLLCLFCFVRVLVGTRFCITRTEPDVI